MALSAKYRTWKKAKNKKSQNSCYRKRNTPTLCLTEGAFEEMVAPLGHVHVETWVRVLQHHLVPPLLWRRRPVCLHLLHLVRLENHEDGHGRRRDEFISRSGADKLPKDATRMESRESCIRSRRGTVFFVAVRKRA